MHMSMMPDDVVALIIGKPNFAALQKIFAIQTYNNQSCCTEKYLISSKQTRNALIPCFNFLMTCKRYYSDTFKNKVGNIIATHYFPQGIMLFLLPKSMQITVFKEIPHEAQADRLMPLSLLQKEGTVKELIDLCMQRNVHHNSLLKATESLSSYNDIIYKQLAKPDCDYLTPYTLIEYLHTMLLLKLFHNKEFDQLYDSTIKNFFTVIDNLCLLKGVDLALPCSVFSNESIEKYICKKYQIATEKQRPEVCVNLPLLSLNAPAKSIYERPAEHQYIIKILIDLFLFPDHK
jgi:hypothetical protein